jgi:hypothetical protein
MRLPNMHTPSLDAFWQIELSGSRMAAITVAAGDLKFAGLPCQCGVTQNVMLLKQGLALTAVSSSFDV